MIDSIMIGKISFSLQISMKDTKTVLPAVNGNGDNKNGYHSKQKNAEHDNEELPAEQLKKRNEDNEELVGGCCVCSDDQGFANNALVYCDGKGCTVACHTGLMICFKWIDRVEFGIFVLFFF